MTAILSVLKIKWVRIALLAILVVGLVWFIGDKVRDNIFQKGYQQGIQYQVQVQMRALQDAQKKFDALQASADKSRADLNNQISNLSQANKELKNELAQKERETDKERINYAKTNSGAMSCFGPRDDGLRIINKSFPSSLTRAVQSSSKGTN